MTLPLLLVAIAMMATLTQAAFTFGTVPPAMWTNSQYTVRSTSSEKSPAGGGDRLTLDCGAVATVTPVAGFSLSQALTFDFIITTPDTVTSGNCVFTRTGDFHGPATNSTAFTVAEQRTLTVSPPSSADSPILVGPGGPVALTFTPSADLAKELQVQIKCTSLGSSTSQAGQTFPVQLQSSPGTVDVRVGNSVGLVECNYVVVILQVGKEELAAPGPSFFRIVPSARVVPMLGGVQLPNKVPDSLAPLTTYTLALTTTAPPAMNFGLALYCTHVDMPGESSANFTVGTTDAQSVTFTTPAAPAPGSDLNVVCTWRRLGDVTAFTRILASLSSSFSFYMGDDVAVTSAAASLQLSAANAWRTPISLTVQAGTVFVEGGLQFTGACSAGILSTTTFSLANGLMTATATFTAVPVVGSASAPSCSFTLVQSGCYRRVKVPVADLTFDVAAIAKVKLLAKGLPTANDALVARPNTVAVVPGVLGWPAAAAGVSVVLVAPADMPADFSAVIGLSCSGLPRFGSSVTVTPANATLSGAAPLSEQTFRVAATRANPVVANATVDVVTCTWSVKQGDASQITLPFGFSYTIGVPVQLEVRQNLFNGNPPLSGVVQGQRATFYLQTVGEQAVPVGGDFGLTVTCSLCKPGLHSGEGYVQGPTMQMAAGQAFPVASTVNQKDFLAISPGVVTCHWSTEAAQQWARAFIPPEPTVVTILPLVPMEVRGVPAADDVIPRVPPTTHFYFPQPVAPGQVFTISMAAAPAEAVFHASASNTFILTCNGGAVVSGGGAFLYSEASRGAQSFTLTMPLLTNNQPVAVNCSFYNGATDLGPLAIFTSTAQQRFQLTVVDTPTVLTPVLAGPVPSFAGAEARVVFNPSRSGRAVGELHIDVACAMSPPVEGMTASGYGIGAIVQAGQVQDDLFTFRFRALDIPLTADTTDSALVFGYKLGLSATLTTLTCTHTLLPTVNDFTASFGRADRMLSVGAEPIVIATLPKQSITVTGVPTEPLANTPPPQTISVLPILRDGAAFTDQQTLLVTLNCSGLVLPSNGLLTFAGVGQSSFDAQPITFTVPAVNAGAGNVWLCSWQLGGSDAHAFQLPAAFAIVVGVADSWVVEVVSPSASLFVGGTKQGRLRAPGSMTPTGTMTAECGQGQWLKFAKSLRLAASFTVTEAALEFTFGGTVAGALSCRFRVSGIPAGFPMLPPAPLTSTVLPSQATFTIDGLTGPNIIRIEGGVAATLTIAPTEAPGAGGVTAILSCLVTGWSANTVSVIPSRVFFPTGNAVPQTIQLGRANDRASFVSQCSFAVDGGGGQFAPPAPFIVELNSPKFIIVTGLESEGLTVVPSACGPTNVTIGLSVAPTVAEGAVAISVGCSNVDAVPFLLTFSAASWQPQTVTVRGKGDAASARCRVANTPNYFTPSLFRVEFGSPPVLAVDAPSFVPLGTVAPITMRPPPGMFLTPRTVDLSTMRMRCSHGLLRATALPMAGIDVVVNGASQIDLEYTANGQRAPVIPIAAFSEPNALVAMDLPPPMVTCTWALTAPYGEPSRFSLQPTWTFAVGSPVEITGQLEDGAVSAWQGQTATLIVAPNAAVLADVTVNIECSAGVSAAFPAVTLPVGMGGLSVALTVAANAALGAASCTLTPSGAGRLAVSNSPTVAFTIVEPAPAAPSSTGGDSTASGLSSTGGEPAGTGSTGSEAPGAVSTGGESSTSESSSAGGEPAGSVSTGSESAASDSTGSASTSSGTSTEGASSGPSTDDAASSTGGDSAASDSDSSSSSAGSESADSGSSGPTAGDAASSSSTPSGSVTSGSTASGSSTASKSTASASTASDSTTSGSTAGDSAAGGSTASGSTGSQSADTGAPFSSPSSSGGDDDGAASSSSTAGPPMCVDFECGALVAPSLPGLAALAAMLLAAAVAQRQ